MLKFLIITICCTTVYVCAQENDTKCENCEPLYLTPYLEQDRIQEARKLAEVHHEDFQDVKSYSGFFNVDKQFNSQMFFWYFPSVVNSPDAPLVLWLEGGPGLPGTLGLFCKNGPFEFDNDKIVKRLISWNQDYNLLYVDNPVGVGYSHTNSENQTLITNKFYSLSQVNYVDNSTKNANTTEGYSSNHTSAEDSTTNPLIEVDYNDTNHGFSLNQTSIAENLYSTLKQFLTMFPELQKNELYILGESYGAKYTIHLSHRILHQDENDLKMNLKGFGLFSGYFDPINQLDFGDNLYNMGLIDEDGYEKLKNASETVKQLIREEKWLEATMAEYSIVGGTSNQQSILQNLTGFLNYYNLRRPNKDLDNLFVNQSLIENYLESQWKSLHVGKTHEDTDALVMHKLKPDILKSVAPTFSEILNHYRGVVATGQLDIIVSYPLINNVLNKLNFSSSEEWKTAKRNQWYMNGELCGYYKTAGNLTEILVLDSGHMIPLDQPLRAYDILNKLTTDSWN